MLSNLSPQQARIIEVLRDKDWHCSSEFGFIKDDRRRITDLNRGYMKAKGYEIIGKRCDGRCGKEHSSGLFMRKAIKVGESPEVLSERMVKWFDEIQGHERQSVGSR